MRWCRTATVSACFKIGQRSCEIVGHALHCCEPDPGGATLLIIDGCLGRCVVGAPGLWHRTEVVQDITLEAGQRKSVGRNGGQRKAALNQSQRGLLSILGHLRTSRRQVSLSGLGILGAFEMFGTQQKIPIGVQFRRAPVQLASPAPEQVVVYRVSDQHVREQEHLAARLLRPQEKPRDQSLRNVIRPDRAGGPGQRV